MKSMTGHGRGECSHSGCKVTVEISSVNRKQTEIALSLARELDPLEAQVRDAVNRRVARGRLNVRVVLHQSERAAASHARLNAVVARAYARDAAQLAKSLRLSTSLTLDGLLRLPGVVEVVDPGTEAESLWPAVESALGHALDALLRMREREGRHLAKDLRTRVVLMRRTVKDVQSRAPAVAVRYREQLMERIRAAGVDGLRTDDDRLLKEVSFFAERSDISEELTRLESHFQQFDQLVASAEPIGRTLDFLAQEINREVNTIGSKANDAELSRCVVTLKAEVEKFREQVQNVE